MGGSSFGGARLSIAGWWGFEGAAASGRRPWQTKGFAVVRVRETQGSIGEPQA